MRVGQEGLEKLIDERQIETEIMIPFGLNEERKRSNPICNIHFTQFYLDDYLFFPERLDHPKLILR